MSNDDIRNRLAEIEAERAAALATLHSMNFTQLKPGAEMARWWDAKDTFDALETEKRRLEYKLTPDTTPTAHQVAVSNWVLSDDYDNE